MVVVPGPVPKLIVDEVPIPSDSVCAAVELPTVIRPVPFGAPMVRVPESEAGPIRITDRLVPVAEVKVVLPRLVRPLTFKLVEVTEVPTAVVKVKAPARLVRAETYRLVVVTLVVEILAGEKLVAARLVKKPLVLVTDVPVAVVKPKAPDRVPPVSNR